jgi:hypothetical protein
MAIVDCIHTSTPWDNQAEIYGSARSFSDRGPMTGGHFPDGAGKARRRKPAFQPEALAASDAIMNVRNDQGAPEMYGNGPGKAPARHFGLPGQAERNISFINKWFQIGSIARSGAYSKALMYKPGFIILKVSVNVPVGRILIFPCVFLDRI